MAVQLVTDVAPGTPLGGYVGDIKSHILIVDGSPLFLHIDGQWVSLNGTVVDTKALADEVAAADKAIVDAAKVNEPESEATATKPTAPVAKSTVTSKPMAPPTHMKGH
jgi:hypothetical protein